MGIWDAVCSIAGTLKNQLPDPESVKNAVVNNPTAGILRSSYDHSRSAICTVAAQANRVKESMPDKEGWVRIGMIGWTLTDLAFDKYSTSFTGGLPVYRILKEGVSAQKDNVNVEAAPMHNVKMEQLIKQNIKMGQELQNVQRRLVLMEAAALTARGSGGGGELVHTHFHQNMVGLKHQKTENAIRVLMMKGFSWGDFVHERVVAQHHENGKKETCP